MMKISSFFKRVSWPVVISIAAMHVGAVAALFFFSWPAIFVTLPLLWLTGYFGITLGFHRLLTHRSFKTPKWFEYFVTLCGCLAWQGSPMRWVGVHRVHHKHSDEDTDPHTPNHGFLWSHIFWTLCKDKPSYGPYEFTHDLYKDAFHRFMNKWFWVPQILLAIILFLIGGWPFLLWGVCVRTVIVYHITWLVNSATHTWGYQTFETKDRSTNLWWLAFLTAGEGWHNNHHAFQRSAAHGLKWYEIDTTYLTIKLLKCVGLAKDVILPDKKKMEEIYRIKET